MGILEEIITRLPSKKFGKMTLYFDKDSKYVRLIECEGKYTYVLTATENDKAVHYIKTEIHPGTCVDCKVDLSRAWIIPEVLNIDRAQEVNGRSDVDDVAKLLQNEVYQIVSYTILEDPKFRGSNFSGSLIMVIVENSVGKRYAVPYLLDDDVHGCDENPKGAILGEAYQFMPLGKLSKDGNTLHIENLL